MGSPPAAGEAREGAIGLRPHPLGSGTAARSAPPGTRESHTPGGRGVSAQRALQIGAHSRGPTVSRAPPPGRRLGARGQGGRGRTRVPHHPRAAELRPRNRCSRDPAGCTPAAREGRARLRGWGGRRGRAGRPGGGARGGDGAGPEAGERGWGSGFLQRPRRARGFILRRSSAAEGRAGAALSREHPAERADCGRRTRAPRPGPPPAGHRPREPSAARPVPARPAQPRPAAPAPLRAA